jgi:hypothetical protein
LAQILPLEDALKAGAFASARRVCSVAAGTVLVVNVSSGDLLRS